MDYFGARYFGSSLGRFTSADTPFADQTTVDPQSWNLYAYVRNRPLFYVDPTGNEVEISQCTDTAECAAAIGAATGSEEAAGRVQVETRTEERGFFGKLFGLAPKQTQFISIAGDIDSFRGLSENASRLADLVESDQVSNYVITDVGSPEQIKFDLLRWGAKIVLPPGNATSRVPSQNYYPVAFVHPGGANALGDPRSAELGIPPANRAERTAHELLGHIWAEVAGGMSSKNPGNQEAARRAEQNVRDVGVRRGVKRIH